MEKWFRFLSHGSDDIDFFRPWSDYVLGFRDGYNFWSGLEQLHTTTTTPTLLRIDVKFFDGDLLIVSYGRFSVADAESNYRLTVGDYQGGCDAAKYSEAFLAQNGNMFTTMDRNADARDYYQGGWWYNPYTTDMPGNNLMRPTSRYTGDADVGTGSLSVGLVDGVQKPVERVFVIRQG